MPRHISKLKPVGETGNLVYKAMHLIPRVNGVRYRMAKILGTNPANIANWLYGQKVDPSYCKAIEHFTEGAVKAHELRPDIFPAPGKKLPVHPNVDKGMHYGAEIRGGN